MWRPLLSPPGAPPIAKTISTERGRPRALSLHMPPPPQQGVQVKEGFLGKEFTFLFCLLKRQDKLKSPISRLRLG